MAKAKASNETKKVTFGVRRKGKHAKTSGPKDSHTKKSRGQGK
jgi:hypothetical protein